MSGKDFFHTQSKKIDRAAHMWTSRQKNYDGVLPSEFFVGARSCNTPRLPVNEPSPNQTAQRTGEQADKKTGGCFPSVCLSVRSSFERGILRADESRPRSSILYGLARGKTKYRRKRSAQNRFFLTACAVKKKKGRYKTSSSSTSLPLYDKGENYELLLITVALYH